jgi:hypothetical protein
LIKGKELLFGHRGLGDNNSLAALEKLLYLAASWNTSEEFNEAWRKLFLFMPL